MALQPTKDQCERMRGGHLFKDTYREPVQPELVQRHLNHEPQSPERYKYWQHKYCQRCGFEAVKKETEQVICRLNETRIYYEKDKNYKRVPCLW